MAFKNALCGTPIPEYAYAGRSQRHCLCQRKADHKMPHRSWSREWNDKDIESKPRRDEVKHEQ